MACQAGGQALYAVRDGRPYQRRRSWLDLVAEHARPARPPLVVGRSWLELALVVTIQARILSLNGVGNPWYVRHRDALVTGQTRATRRVGRDPLVYRGNRLERRLAMTGQAGG